MIAGGVCPTVGAGRRLELGHEFDAACGLPEQMTNSVTSGVSADHPGVNELFALLAYGEVAAFYRLADEARMAPNLAGRINMASMAAEMNHYEVLEMRWSAGESTWCPR